MSAATTLAARVDQYLAERRRLGFGLWTMSYALHSLVEHVRCCQHHGPLTLELMAQWAPQAKQGPGDRSTWARRLELLRPFTRWLRQFEPDTEVPEEPIFGRVPGRVAPHIYNDDEIAALLDTAGRIGPPSSPRGAVVRTVFALMACTGMRVSEALALTDVDVDWKQGVLTVRNSKCRHSRLVPLHPSAVSALRHYRAERDRYVTSTPDTPLFIACRGRRLGQPFCGRQLKRIFDELRRRLGWTSRGGRDMPRLHDLRHTFAVRRLLQWHEQGVDMHQRMLALSTYFGHVKVSDTYWYLSAVPELMACIGTRFERYVDAGQGRWESDDA
jgi:integrase